MPRIKAFVSILLLVVGVSAQAGPSQDFNTLLADAWDWQLTQYPEFASRLGDRRNNDQWTDISLAAYKRRHAEQSVLLRRLRVIDSS